jgi:hypothetical protein
LGYSEYFTFKELAVPGSMFYQIFPMAAPLSKPDPSKLAPLLPGVESMITG